MISKILLIKPLQDFVPEKQEEKDDEGDWKGNQPHGDGQRRVLLRKGGDSGDEGIPQQAFVR